MGKYLVTCSIVILIILFHIDIVSLSRSGSSRSSGGNKRGSHHKPSRPVHQPSKPSRPVHQPSKPSRPVHQPSKPSRPVHQPIKPVHQPSRPVHKPVKPAENPVKPVQEVPVQSARQPAQNPSWPQNNPVKPPQNPAYPPHNPANPAQNPAYPPHNPANPAQNPIYPPHNPAQNPAYPPHNPANPAYPPQNPANPARNPAYPPHNPANPAQNPVYPPHNPANPVYPPHNPANPAYPPHNPANPAYPPHNPANPAYPPHNPANPAQNPAYPPQNPGYPQHNPAYPPQNPGYPQHNPAYPPQNPGYPQHNPGYPHNPNYPQNPGYPQHNPGYPHNPNYPHKPSWGQNDVKPWKPKPPKTNLKYMAGAAVAGAFGGFLLGHAMSQMHFRFPNPEEERWWYANRDRYPAQVYYPKYEQPVPEDIFVRDCWNMTVREFVEPSGNETADEMEARVVTRVVHEMCIEQYRTFSGHAGGGSVTHSQSDPQKPNPAQPVMNHVQGEAVAGTVVESSGVILGTPMANMSFQFNESEEERWWNENRHRFMDHVFRPNYNHPVPLDVFVSDCVNVTMGEYLKPSGNETANETETRVLRRLVPEMCTELYHNYSRQIERDGFGKSDNKPEESIMPVKLAIKDMAVAPPRNTAAKGSGSYTTGGAVSNMIFHFKDGLLLTSPSILWVIMLTTCFLIP
ncbi:DNA-directed RNA polymerase II subunit RPB1-like isoform X2 [Sceloporus undulatus]|uniref:DNA-directed RNA polymerase II subunit RPB1-like isoform X2 n=1 Tax=Sceloporus undulatus TaxID=8520 RepID=UPI001C4C69FB|nr:DNA-directed RNA polymerase II subunit RPB1-like isoform X2 [Sceloporus undulatus]